MYIITRTDRNGKTEKAEYNTFCYAVNQLLLYIYNPVHGDYTITFTRHREKQSTKISE